LGSYLAAHSDKCPLNGTELTSAVAISALVAYVATSLLTYRHDFDMERMLHRGPYAIESEDGVRGPTKKGFGWAKLIGINEDFSSADKALSLVTFLWVAFLQLVVLGILLWWLVGGKLSDGWWFHYTMVTGLWIPFGLAIITTIWFTIGTTRDILDLLKTLKVARHNDEDDGTVRDHHNLGEPL
jgi:SSS family solute:Na+ symporter